MQKADEVRYSIFVQIKNKIGFHRSQSFKDWFHNKYPGMDPHHPFGSNGMLKTSDYTCIPLPRVTHSAIRNEPLFAIENLDLIFDTMQRYIIYLEEKCQLNEK